MSSKAVALVIAMLATGALVSVQAQEKTRADVKAETRAAGVKGDATAESPTPTGKVQGGETRAQVKAETRAAGKSLNDPAASYAPPGQGVKSTKNRADVKADTRASGVRGDATADSPTPAPVRK